MIDHTRILFPLFTLAYDQLAQGDTYSYTDHVGIINVYCATHNVDPLDMLFRWFNTLSAKDMSCYFKASLAYLSTIGE